jgi:hypothetical protein
MTSAAGQHPAPVTDPAVLAVAYAIAVDRRDAATLARLFTPDARVRLPAGMSGPHAPAATISPAELLAPLQRWHSTRHVVMQQQIVIDADGTHASGECYSEAHHVSVGDSSEASRSGSDARDLVLHLRYLDDFVRDEAGWRFASRELVVDWSSRQPVRLWD